MGRMKWEEGLNLLDRLYKRDYLIDEIRIAKESHDFIEDRLGSYFHDDGYKRYWDNKSELHHRRERFYDCKSGMYWILKDTIESMEDVLEKDFSDIRDVSNEGIVIECPHCGTLYYSAEIMRGVKSEKELKAYYATIDKEHVPSKEESNNHMFRPSDFKCTYKDCRPFNNYSELIELEENTDYKGLSSFTDL